MDSSIDIRRKWETNIRPVLMNKTIKNIRYLTDEEAEDLGWHSSCIAIFLDDGTIIFPSSDDEGNDAGALFTTDDSMPTIPVIRL